MRMEFSKYSGCGNDFILIDNRSHSFPAADPALIQKLCARCTGIGADGLILLENSLKHDFRMRIFNADGIEAEMCGNGIRCLMKFIQEKGFPKTECTIETYLRPLRVSLQGEDVCVEMGKPFDFMWNLELEIDQRTFLVHHLNTGVPHLVLFCDSLEEFDLKALGPKFRHHPKFLPQGTNFNVAQLMPDGQLRNRTFERGVEEETLACGTGCTAAAIAAHYVLKIPAPVQVRTRSEELLQIDLKLENDQIHEVRMTGPAVKTFEGRFSC